MNSVDNNVIIFSRDGNPSDEERKYNVVWKWGSWSYRLDTRSHRERLLWFIGAPFAVPIVGIGFVASLSVGLTVGLLGVGGLSWVMVASALVNDSDVFKKLKSLVKK